MVTFRTLARDECEALLARNVVGRIAFTLHDRVDIEPIHYALDGPEAGWIYGRTSPGSKLSVLAHHPWVAFEVDEIRALFDWASVVVHGTVYRLRPDAGTPAERRRFEDALAALRGVLPSTLEADDPVAFRDVIFGIHVDAITGRGASE